jgi:hypothetical protein
MKSKKSKTGSAHKRRLHGVVQHREELKGIKRVLTLVDGYLSKQPQDLLLGWDGGIMTYGELRKHLNAALKTKVLNAVLSGKPPRTGL